jgi:cellulose synthase/poly-beta-1,6-N-acetylglucosamine synthase-like glycosyltransferase
MPELIFIITICLYFSFLILITIGLRKKFTQIKTGELRFATIIVAARNEETNIGSCLDSLNNLIYPEGKLEIIIVDDFSEDNTGRIIEEFIKDKPLFRKINPDKNSDLKGKVNAVASAIKDATGEIILLTDADCTVPETWAETIASYYKNGVGIVNGFTILNNNDVFSGIQSVDLVFLLSSAAGTINLNYPVSCIGNNMSFRKSAYIEAGGYEKLPFSVTEDFMLLKGIAELNKYKIIYPLDKKALVVSNPCPDLKELIKQKKRWGRGGFDAPIGGMVIMGTAFLANLMLLLSPLFFSTVWLYLAVFKIIADYFFLIPVHNELGTKLRVKYFIFFQIYFILYTVILPLILLFSRKISWKGRNY